MITTSPKDVTSIVAAEEARLKVGSLEFMERHVEIMNMVDRIEKHTQLTTLKQSPAENLL